MKPNLTTVFKPQLIETNNNQEQIKNLQQGVVNLSPKIEDNREARFSAKYKECNN